MGTKHGNGIKTDSLLGLPRILQIGAKLYRCGLYGKGYLIGSRGTGGVSRPSADLVGFGWLGFAFFACGTSCVRGILLGISTKTRGGRCFSKGTGNSLQTSPRRLGCLGGSDNKFGT